MSQDQRRNGHRPESHVLQVHGVCDVAHHHPDRCGTEAAPDERPMTAQLTAKASRALAIRAAKARWSGRKKEFCRVTDASTRRRVESMLKNISRALGPRAVVS